MEDPDFIGDWYRERKLGTGAFGIVMLWRNKRTEERVAIKKCLEIPPNEFNEKQKERWNREVEYMMNEINNENIVKGIKIEPHTFYTTLSKTSPLGMPILIMEYCEGGDLRHLLNANCNSSGLPESEIRNILKSIGNAISYLHKLKITHRDIKPENIVIKNDGFDKKVYKLTDLGYAKGLDCNSLKASLVGTIEYVAPELLFTEKYSCTVDYWSFGIITFEIITGKRPFVPHLPLAQWFITVKKKKSENICITEDQNDIHYENHIFDENHISKTFAKNIEEWLTIALEWNPKQRGSIFEIPKNTKAKIVLFADGEKSSNETDGNSPPVQVLKIFTLLDDILKRKILTIFCLHSYEYLSYEISESSTMDWLIENIEKDTQISKDKIRFTISLDNPKEIGECIKPMDFYLEDYYDKPMLYVRKMDITINKKDIKMIVPKSVQLVLANPDIDLKPFMFKNCLYDTYYFIRKEQEKYLEYLKGYRNYVLEQNHDIIVHEVEVNRMIRMLYSLEGSLKMYGASLKELQNNFSDILKSNLTEQHDKHSLNITKLLAACDKIQQRYRSALRRSNEAKQFKKLIDIERDHFSIKDMDKTLEIIRSKLAQKTKVEKKDLYKKAYYCMKQRDQLLNDEEFIKWKEMTPRVDIEMVEIKKSVENAIAQIEKYKEEVFAANSSLLKTVSGTIKPQTSNTKLDYLPDIDGILSKEISQTSLDFKIGQIVSDDLKEKYGESILCFGEGIDAAALIEANEKLRLTMDGLIKDIDIEMSESGSN